jgi:hypothetical protein
VIAHPLLVVIGVVDLAALVLLAVAARTALRVVLAWDPAASAPGQLALESEIDATAPLGRAAAWLWLGSCLAWLVAVAVVLPTLVPGAMCGTGVLRAMQTAGPRALILRGAGLGVLGVWSLLDRLDSRNPRGLLVPTTARTLLLALPLAALAFLDTVQGFVALDPAHPVDCCTVVYGGDRVGASLLAPGAPLEPMLVALWASASALLLAVAFGRLRSRARLPWGGRWLALAAVAWAGLTWVTLERVLVAYHYGVLEHHCLWCLLRPENRALGLPLLAGVAVVLVEGLAAVVLDRVARGAPDVRSHAVRRARRGVARLLLALALVLALAAGPALLWRLRFGVWM